MIHDHIELAIEQAKKSELFHRHGAILFFKRRIYSKGYNRFNLITVSIHAEIDCFLKLRENPKLKFTSGHLLVVRLNSNNKLANSKPCVDCLEKLKKIGIKKIYYSDAMGRIVEEKIRYASSSHVCSGKKMVLRRRMEN